MLNILNEKLNKKQILTQEEQQTIEFREAVTDEYKLEIRTMNLPFSVEEKIMELLIDENEADKQINEKEVNGV